MCKYTVQLSAKVTFAGTHPACVPDMSCMYLTHVPDISPEVFQTRANVTLELSCTVIVKLQMDKIYLAEFTILILQNLNSVF